MKVTPAMIAAARDTDPVFASASDDAIKAALVAALNVVPGARPSPVLAARVVTSRIAQKKTKPAAVVVYRRKPKPWRSDR